MLNLVAFEIFGFPIRWYGIFISCAVIIGAYLALKEGKRAGVDEDTLIDLFIFAVPISAIGARIYYVIFSWYYYKDHLREIFNFRGGGLAIHGTIIAAVLVAIIFCRKRKLNFWKITDICAPSIILGQSIGRWGNFTNQEAHGGPTNLPWGIIINGQKVHPTFLYESIWDLAVFFFLLWYRRNKEETVGETFLLYLALYSVGRFWIEGLRTDSLMLGNIRVAQLVSVITVIGAAVVFRYRRKNVDMKYM